MRKYLFATLLLIPLLMASCGKKSAEEIFEEQKSGVVLVLNKFYYQVEMPTGNKLFFTGIDSNGNLQGFTSDEREAKQNAQMLNGTGFFVSDDADIAVDFLVVRPDIAVFSPELFFIPVMFFQPVFIVLGGWGVAP